MTNVIEKLSGVLDLMETKTLNTGIVILTYRVNSA
jgi:hypothetical protein